MNWFAKSAPLDTVSLYYHSVSDNPPPHQRLYRIKNTAEFRQDLDWLHGQFGFVDYPELASEISRKGGRRTPNRVLLTFDDGFVECSNTIAPILKEQSAPAVFFVTTGFLNDNQVFVETQVALCIEKLRTAAKDVVEEVAEILRGDEAGNNRRKVRRKHAQARLQRLPVVPTQEPLRWVMRWLLMTTENERDSLDKVSELLQTSVSDYVATQRIFLTDEEVKALASAGFTIGAHSVRHRHLQSLPESEQRTEILDSCDRIRQLTSQTEIPFSFPYSARGVDDRVLSEIRRRNPFVGLYFDTGGLRSRRPSMIRRCAADLPDKGFGESLAILLKRNWHV